MTRTITVERYDPVWQEEFEKIKGMLYLEMWGFITGIVHIGSTSVPGLSAKPVIDLIVITDSYADLPDLCERLEILGYEREHEGGNGGWETFRSGENNGLMDHCVCICPKNSEELLRQTAFWDYLRTHPDQARCYGILKSYLALKFPHDADSYLAGKREAQHRIVKKWMFMLKDNDYQ